MGWNCDGRRGWTFVSRYCPNRHRDHNPCPSLNKDRVLSKCRGSYILPWLLDNQAYGLFLGLTGKRLRAKETIQFGLATHYLKKAPKFVLQRADEEVWGRSDWIGTEEDCRWFTPSCQKDINELSAQVKYHKDLQVWFDWKHCEESEGGAAHGDKLAEYCSRTFEKVSPFGVKLTFEILKIA